MPLPEIEFELTADQYAQMGYPGIRQGEPLSVILDAGLLLPDLAAESWFSVQPDPLPSRFVRFGPALYAFAGPIVHAEILQVEESQSAVLQVHCGVVQLRVTCAPLPDGRLPYGTWETRYLTGVGRVQGLVEDAFKTAVGSPTQVTVWHLRRLVLSPGDPLFGQWHESATLLPLPLHSDRVVVVARVHRERL